MRNFAVGAADGRAFGTPIARQSSLSGSLGFSFGGQRRGSWRARSICGVWFDRFVHTGDVGRPLLSLRVSRRPDPPTRPEPRFAL